MSNKEECGILYKSKGVSEAMKRILIALPAGALGESMTKALREKYEITVCTDGIAALAQLRKARFDMLVIDLMIERLDGLSLLMVLRQDRPENIIVISALLDDMTVQRCLELGVTGFLPKPCRICSVVQNIEHILSIKRKREEGVFDPQMKTAKHLRELELAEYRDGFQHLKVGTPLYAADPCQSLTKELYPRIAQLCGNGDGKQVERAIRIVTEEAWDHRNPEVWEKYFGKQPKRPSNKIVLSNLARVLEEDWEAF